MLFSLPNSFLAILMLISQKPVQRRGGGRGGSRGRVQGVRTPPPQEMTCGFLIQLVFRKKKNYVVYWC